MKMKRLACKEGICKRTVEEIGVKQGTDLRRPADIKIVMVKRPVTVPFLVGNRLRLARDEAEFAHLLPLHQGQTKYDAK